MRGAVGFVEEDGIARAAFVGHLRGKREESMARVRGERERFIQ